MTFKGVPITYSVWDLGRLHRFVTSGHEREDYMVSLDEFGGPLLVLPAHMQEADYESYLAVFPGRQLARIYGPLGAPVCWSRMSACSFRRVEMSIEG